MRAILLGTGACLTVATFVAAERFSSSAANTVALEQQTAIQAALDGQLKQSKVQFAALKDAKDIAEGQVNALTSSVAKLTTERDGLAKQVALSESEAADVTRKLVEIEAINSGMAERFELQQASLGEKNAELDALRAKIDEYAQRVEGEVGNGPEEAELLDEIASLSETIKARDEALDSRDEQIASLQTAIEAAQAIAAAAEANAAAPSETAEGSPNLVLARELELARDEIEKLNAASTTYSEETDARISELTETLLERDANLAELEAQLAALSTPAAEIADASSDTTQVGPDEELEALSARLAELNDLVLSQTKTISSLRMGFVDDTASAMEMAEACIERANKIFEISQIKFATGTVAISDDSRTTLDHLRDLAIGCESEDMFIEIGGHTDSFGAESDNQTLSERRAASVRDFLIARGIDAETMVAVGFGEAQPIAPNDTAAGRAQNRRITFTWRMREDDSSNADG